MLMELQTQPLAPSPSIFQQDRRKSVKSELNLDIMYRTSRLNRFESGVLKNISDTGMLITTYLEIDEDIRIHVIIPQDKGMNQPVNLIGQVVRDASQATKDSFTYGCQLKEMFGLE